MTGAERGWLLLGADLGDGRKPLTLPQLRILRLRVRQAEPTGDPDRPLGREDLTALGFNQETADRIVTLLERDRALEDYLGAAARQGIGVLTERSPGYPARLRQRLGDDAPPVLFYWGSPTLLTGPAVSLTGSRDLNKPNAAFARRVGALAAAEGLTLVSGNARGADLTAQTACLQAGGSVVSVLPCALTDCEPVSERQLLICEEGWHLPFSAGRALRRNRLIYALAEACFVAQSGTSGGTFRGASEYLRHGGCPVYVYDDGSSGCRELLRRGAVGLRSLDTIAGLRPDQLSLWEEEPAPRASEAPANA